MAWTSPSFWLDVFGGYNAQTQGVLRQDRTLLELATASNVIPDPLGDLVSRPGFSHVRATTTGAAHVFTGMFHLQDLADKFILWNSSDGKPYQDSANPPVALSGGTAFTTGADVLVRGTVFNNKLIAVSNARNLPQTIDATPTWADLGGTPARGVDVKSFARRVCMFSPIYSGTTYRSIMSFTSSNDDETAWTNPVTINFLNFGRTGADVNLLGGEVYKSQLIAFTEDRAYPVYATPNATIPLAFRDALFTEDGGGPASIHSVVAANDKLYWLSRNFDVKVMSGLGAPKSIGYPIQPLLRGLNDSRRQYAVGGGEPQYRLVIWSVSNGADTQNKTTIALQVDTGHYYIHTIQVNALANRIVSGELRLIGGHYNGLFSNLYDSSTTGDLQTAATAIDADTITPPLHLGMPGVFKKIPYCVFEFDTVASEAVTLQYDLDQSGSWTSFAESTFSPTDGNPLAYCTIPAPFERISLRIRNNTSGARYRVLRIGFPAPRVAGVSR